MFLILFAILLPSALGLTVAALLFRDDPAPAPGLLDRLCIAYPLGMGLLTFQMFLLALLRIPLTLGIIAPLLLAETGALAWWARRRQVPVLPAPSFGLWQEISGGDAAIWKRVALALLTAWAVFKIGSVFLEASLRPIFAWDTWANWSAGAKVFFYDRGLLLDASAGQFFGRDIVSRLQSYPLHNHLLQTWFALWAGGFDEVMVKLWAPVYLLVTAAAVYGFAHREIGRLAALGLTVLFLGSPLLSYHAIEAYSDMMLGSHLFFALLSLLRAMRGSAGSWQLAGFFSAAALFTKNEAPGFVLPLLLSAGYYLWTERRGVPLAGTTLRLMVPFAFVAPWFLFKAFYGLSLTQDAHQITPVWHPGVLSIVMEQFLGFQNFGILFAGLAVLLLLNGRPSRELLHALFPLTFYICFFILLYYLIDYYYSTLLIGTVFFRNALTYYPAASLVAVMAVRDLQRKTALTPASSPLPKGETSRKTDRRLRPGDR